MGPRLKLCLNEPGNGQYYVSNEAMSGNVVLELDRPASIISLSVTIRGTSQTFTQSSGSDYLMHTTFGNRSCHTLVHQKQELFPPENVRGAITTSKKGFQVSKGLYSYGFEFLVPYWLKCFNDHGAKSAGFNRTLEDPRLPPSFNSDAATAGLVDFENSYYKMGSVTYYMKATLVLGKIGFRLTPGNTIIEAYQGIEYIPTPRCDGNQAHILQANIGPTQSFVSKKTLKVNDSLDAWIEVKARSLSRVYRLDRMFQRGCQRFDKVSLVLSQRPVQELNIKIRRLTLQLVEIMNYLSQGQVNAMVGTIPLVETQLDLKLNSSKIKTLGNGTIEWPLELCRIPELANYKFNEANITHRGNKMFSFASCNIKRAFKFCLSLGLEIDGSRFDAEVLTTMCDIELSSIEDHEELPSYKVSDVPPNYTND
ncbi:LANO_0G12266g1_1 [Lachancea nothofagi CBS 11611]|uniref:LANO_0G12266g1_1 n=1 Tax=Lachancea nothofagi CBS 11611 TaxID=1266666 RepID=A0A1G4KJN3_9SACH|nr:LANO_0G12266g1_1 [Lachancea nothofagi CBS 11611]